MRADLVANAADECTEVEGDERAQRLLIRLVECLIAVSRGAFKQAAQGDGQLLMVSLWKELIFQPAYLSKISSLEPTPDEDGREGYNITRIR